LDYNTYLGYAGLTIDIPESQGAEKIRKYTIHRLEKMDTLQSAILKTWLGEG